MCNKPVSTFVLLLWCCLLATPAAAHSMHMHMTAPAVANDCTTPSPTCAQTVTPAVDHQGNLWRAFVNGKTLYVQERQQNGSFAKAYPVNSTPEAIDNRGEDRPQLAFGPKGEIYLAWTTPLPTDYSGNIRFSRSLDGGRHFSAPITLNHDRHLTAHRFPAMATNADGNIFITWIDKRDQFATAKKADKPWAAIYYNWSNDQGAHFQNKDLRLENKSCECCRIAMAIDDKGLPLVFFRDIFPGSQRDHALVSFVSASEPKPAQRITFDHWELHGCPHQGPAILHADGRTHFFWFDRKQLYYRYQQADGTLSAVQDVGGPGSERASLAAANGVLYRSWQRYKDNAMTVWLQTSKDHGAHWSAPREVTETKGGSDYPLLVSNGKTVWLSWLTRNEGHQLLPLTGETP